MRWSLLVLIAVALAALFVCSLAQEDVDEETVPSSPPPSPHEEEEKEASSSKIHEILEWTSPPIQGSVVMFEGFDKGMSAWHLSKNPKFTGQWQVTKPSAMVGIAGDDGLMMASAAHHHAIFRPFKLDTTDKDLVVQYEVKLQKTHECGGAYLKLVKAQDNMKPGDFDNQSPYIIMFGPDKCGSSNKVHFILRHQNPLTKEWEEKHLKSSPVFPVDKKTHLYTLIVRQDNTYEILIDNKSVKEGSLFEDFSPPINPPKEIDDPNDQKPEDWEDDARIPDPDATKPEDWDEDAPPTIPDPEDTKPEDWLDDEPLRIPDPNAEQPEGWDEDEDGEWQLPLIENPKCASGKCGVWTPRMIRNPDYKGKWLPPMIDNPRFKGAWKPRTIPNPDFYEDKNPSNMPLMGGLGLELWTMQDQVLFDNFFVGHDVAAARDFAERTFGVKRSIEEEREMEEVQRATKMAKGRKLLDIAQDVFFASSLHDALNALNEAVATHPLPVIGLIIGLFVGFPLFVWKALFRRTVVVDMEKVLNASNKESADGVRKEDEEEEEEEEDKEKEKDAAEVVETTKEDGGSDSKAESDGLRQRRTGRSSSRSSSSDKQ